MSVSLRRLSEEEAQRQRLVRFYEEAERDIIQELNRALLVGNNTRTLQVMRGNIKQIIKDLRKGSRTWCEKAIPSVYKAGVAMADRQLERIGQATVVTGFTEIHQQAAQVLAENAYNRFEDVAQVIGRRVDDIYRTMALENIRGNIIGISSWKQTAIALRERLAKQGVTGFKDTAGRNWNMTTYANMVARTTTMEAKIQGTVNRFLEHGHDLVRVGTHFSPCRLCSPWQGRILSITGKTSGYPTLADAKAAGLFHPNCRDTIGLFLPDIENEAELEEGRPERWYNEGDRIYIPQSVGAAAKRIYVQNRILFLREPVYIKEGTYINCVTEMARGNGIHVVQNLITDYPLPNGTFTSPEDWSKMAGQAVVVSAGKEYVADVHWYQGKNIGKVEWKVKKKLRVIKDGN